MADLSHWDFAEVFSAHDAAALIFGVDPAVGYAAGIRPILTRMEDAYLACLHGHQDQVYSTASIQKNKIYGVEPSNRDLRLSMLMAAQSESETYQTKTLHSLRMTAFYEASNQISWLKVTPDMQNKFALAEIAEERFIRWLFDDLRNGFDHQYFERYEINRWLLLWGMKSVYQFGERESESVAIPLASLPAKRFGHGRRDFLAPVVEHAQSQCKNIWDAPEVWSKLQALARQKYGPLIGVDESGIQYVDANDKFKTLNYSSLGMRLSRARAPTLTND